MSEDVAEFYAKIRPAYEAFTAKLAGLVEELLQVSGIDVVQIEHRCKTIESLEEKANRPGKSYGNPLIDVTDLAGLRIITYYTEDAARVCEIIRREFEVDESNSEDKALIAAPDQFGYVSTHLVVKLSSTRIRLTEWRAFTTFVAEIQVRTVLQHAWAAISHKLQYKSEAEVPSIQRRRLSRLSALLELADEQFSELRVQTSELVESYQTDVRSGQLEIELNLVSLGEYIHSNHIAQILEQLAAEAGWDAPMFSVSQDEPSALDPDHALRNALRHNYISRSAGESFNAVHLSGVRTIAELDALANGHVSDIGPVLAKIAAECKQLDFVPHANPVDPLVILVWYAKRIDLSPNIVDMVPHWHPVGREVTRSVIFGDESGVKRLEILREAEKVAEHVRHQFLAERLRNARVDPNDDDDAESLT